MRQRMREMILTVPGPSVEELCDKFGLTNYRLNRTLRQIERELSDQVVVRSDRHGVWIVSLDTGYCSAMVWHGRTGGGFRQCTEAPAFDDGKCYDHSCCENPEMTAFRRRLTYLAGPANPSAFLLSQLSLTILEQLTDRLTGIQPWTRSDTDRKSSLTAMLRSALATARWKRMMREREIEQEIPHDIRDRHRRSSVNPFEFSAKKHFVVLEVPTDATREEVLKAWRRLARKYHPDSEGGDEERMKVVNLAKEKIFRLRRWD